MAIAYAVNVARLGVRESRGSMAQTPIIMAEEVTKRFGTHQVLTRVSLPVMERDVVCVVGPSGSGKTTLLRCLALLETPTMRIFSMPHFGQPNGTIRWSCTRNWRRSMERCYHPFAVAPAGKAPIPSPTRRASGSSGTRSGGARRVPGGRSTGASLQRTQCSLAYLSFSVSLPC